MSILWHNLTRQALEKRLQQAYNRGDKQLIRRISVWLEIGRHGTAVATVAQQWDLSPATIYGWTEDFIIRRLDSLTYR